MHRKSAGTLAITLVLVTMARFAAAASSVPTGLISPSWERIVPNNWPPRAGAPGLVLSDILRTSDGRLIALGKVDSKPSLFIDPDTTGPGKIISPPIGGDRLRIAEGSDGILWIGGFKNERYEGFGSSLMSEAYLVKLDSEGRVVWERSFGTDTQRTIESLASLPSGAVIVSGRDRWTNWLAKISPQGQIEWERFLGVARGTSVSVAHDNIFLAGLDAGHADGGGYQEDVVLWSLDSAAGTFSIAALFAIGSQPPRIYFWAPLKCGMPQMQFMSSLRELITVWTCLSRWPSSDMMAGHIGGRR